MRIFGETKAENRFSFANWNEIPITQLRLDSGFERSEWQEKYFHENDTDAIKRLRASMDRDGMRNPALAVMDGGKVVLLAGFRRVKCALSLGWESVPARIHPGPLTPAQQEWIVIDDNANRRGGYGAVFAHRKSMAERVAELIKEIDPKTAQEIKLGVLTSKELQKRTGVSTSIANETVAKDRRATKERAAKSIATRYPAAVDKGAMKVVNRSITVIARSLRNSSKPTMKAGIAAMKQAIRELGRL